MLSSVPQLYIDIKVTYITSLAFYIFSLKKKHSIYFKLSRI